MEGCPCEACTQPHAAATCTTSRAASELTGARLLTLHNLTFMAELMRGLREAIVQGRYAEHAGRVLAGEEPF